MSATLLADTGVDISALKRHEGRKSSCVAESYIAYSLVNKNVVTKKILCPEIVAETCGSSMEVMKDELYKVQKHI